MKRWCIAFIVALPLAVLVVLVALLTVIPIALPELDWLPGRPVTAVRWTLLSSKYKAEVLSQPTSSKGELKHIEWEGWGFPGAGNTVAYLVFDPADTLSSAARNRQPGRFKGIPCEVPLVAQLEGKWYTVRFYTEEAWGASYRLNCSGSAE